MTATAVAWISALRGSVRAGLTKCHGYGMPFRTSRSRSRCCLYFVGLSSLRTFRGPLFRFVVGMQGGGAACIGGGGATSAASSTASKARPSLIRPAHATLRKAGSYPDCVCAPGHAPRRMLLSHPLVAFAPTGSRAGAVCAIGAGSTHLATRMSTGAASSRLVSGRALVAVAGAYERCLATRHRTRAPGLFGLAALRRHLRDAFPGIQVSALATRRDSPNLVSRAIADRRHRVDLGPLGSYDAAQGAPPSWRHGGRC